MKRKSLILIIMTLILSLFLVACEEGAKSPKSSEIENTEIEKKKKDGSKSVQAPDIVSTSLEVLELIKDKNYEELADHIHPEKGVRFSPYFFVDPANHQVLTPQQVEDLSQNSALINWGTFDGTGDTISLNFNDYYDRFIFDHDYTSAPLTGINIPVGVGNIMDNVSIEYPDGEFMEYHFTGFDPQYEGMDWRSLRLVFEESNGTLYLVAIVHGEWTT